MTQRPRSRRTESPTSADRDDLVREWAERHEERALAREVEDLRAQVADMEGSRSWRWTRPLRLVERYGPKALARLRELHRTG